MTSAKLIGTVAGNHLVENNLLQSNAAFSSEIVLDAPKADLQLSAQVQLI